MKTNPSLIRVLSLSLVAAALPAGLTVQTRAAESAPAREVRVVDRDGRDVRVVETRRILKKGDRDFLEKAAKVSMSEVAISRIAAARTSNPEVRKFAQAMIEDHERANEELSAFATARGIALPAKDPHPDRWEKRDAKSFDKDYIEKMISDHEDVVKMFTKHATDGDDADAVAFARKHLPRMQAHLQHATDLKRTLTDKRR